MPPEKGTEIRFVDPKKNITIGKVKEGYGSLVSDWSKNGLKKLLDSMLTGARPNGLDWYADELTKRIVVMGHTHHTELKDHKDSRYANDGSFCSNTKDPTPSYVEITMGNSGTNVSTINWK